MAEVKWSKECKTCARRYPSMCGVGNCLECRKPLERTQKAPNVTDEEFKDLCFVYGRTVPGPLSVEEREKMEQEWEALEAEVERRAPWFSIADLIGDNFSVRAA